MSADRLQLWKTYVRVVETGSFSAVARELDSTQPQVSRQIAQLEKSLGVRLLRRSTRQLSMTDEGEHFYADARRIIADVEESEARLRGADQPRGLLRVACPSALSRIKLLPMMSTFLDRYPELELEFSVSDRYADLVGEGIDVALRVGEVTDTELHARRIGTARRICVASPAYLARNGTPATPADLREHQCVTYTMLTTGATWPFERMPVKVQGRVRGNTPDVILAMVQSGQAIGMAPSWLFTEGIKCGEVTRILDDWPIPTLPIHALYMARRQVPARVRLLVEHLSAAFARDAEIARTDLVEPQATDGRN